MAFWFMLDDSPRPDELAVGAAASALAALLATVVSRKAFHATNPGHSDAAAGRQAVGAGWRREAVSLPGQVLRDTALVYVALGRMVARGGPPPGGYTEISLPYGDGSTQGVVRRVLLTWARSVAPNSFVVGMDPDRDVMIVHRLAVGAPEQDGKS